MLIDDLEPELGEGVLKWPFLLVVSDGMLIFAK